MENLFRLLVIGIASSLDNLVVGLAYGIRGKIIPPLSNLILAGIAFTFTVISAQAGSYLRLFIPEMAATLAGAVMLLGIGVYMIVPRRARPAPSRTGEDAQVSIRAVMEDPERGDRDHSGVIDVNESFLLGVALALNCLTNSLPAGLWKLNIPVMAGINALFSYLSVWGGVRLGKRFGHLKWLETKANPISGWLLILLGLYQAFRI